MKEKLLLLVVLLAATIAFGQFEKVFPTELCANSLSCVKELSGEFQEGQKTGMFLSKEISAIPSVSREEKVKVLGGTNAYKRIQIDLTNQRLHAYEGDQHVFEFPVSTGKWAPTPTGTFWIWIKLRYTKMEGGNKALGTYYYLPNVPHVMYFYNEKIPKTRGFGLHGAYWHNNFGHPMSHGCVNLPLDAAEKLYQWVDPPTIDNATYATKDNPGTRVIIYGETPKD